MWARGGVYIGLFERRTWLSPKNKKLMGPYWIP